VDGVELREGVGRGVGGEGEEVAAIVDRGETRRRSAVERYRRVESEGGGFSGGLGSVIGLK